MPSSIDPHPERRRRAHGAGAASARAFGFRALFILAALTGASVSPCLAATDALTLERKIPLGEVAGRIDHLAIDPAHRRLFVAELGNDTVGVVDVVHGPVLH